MRILSLGVVGLVVACRQTGGDDFPIQPGGPGHGGGSHLDAAVADASDAGNMLTSKVCVLTDAGNFTSCTGTVTGVTVKLGTNTVIPASDGSFSIAIPDPPPTIVQVSGTMADSGFVPSVVRYPMTTATLPMLSTATYATLQNDNIAIESGTASVFVVVMQNGLAVAGATATTDPAPLSGIPMYEASLTAWNGAATGSSGAIWVPNVGNTTAVGITIQPVGSAQAQNDLGVPVAPDSITFDTVILPQ